MKTKVKIICLFWVIYFVSGCGPLVPQTISIQATEISLPTDTPLGMQIPTQTATSFPTQPPSMPFSIERLRMVYEKDGNIYLQDGMKVAQKLNLIVI